MRKDGEEKRILADYNNVVYDYRGTMYIITVPGQGKDEIWFMEVLKRTEKY